MKTEIVCVIDRSGSMANIATDAVGGYNSFIAEQKSIPGDAKLSLVLFDDRYDVIHDRIDLKDVPELTMQVFAPRGMTALNDALGKSITHLGKELSKNQELVDKVIFVILTDGGENSSLEYSQAAVADMIKHQTEVYSWEFIFLAANQDAFQTGAGYNISAQNTSNFAATGVGTRRAYSAMSGMTSSFRSGK
jgi:Mg-chelatase subunit ChlD